MKIKNLKLSFLFIALASLFFACQESTTISSDATNNQDNATSSEALTEAPKLSLAQELTAIGVAPPIQNVDVAFQKFEVNPSKEKVIKLKNGTSIEIPKSAFVDKEGKEVTTPVTIAYREFHNASEIICSGIPMHVLNENDELEWMQTAGMFEIKGATSDGEAVSIAEGKAVNVNMASEVDGEYGFWYLNPETKSWDTQGTSNAVAVAQPNINSSASLISEGNMSAPTRPVAFSKDKSSFDVDIDYNHFPELKEMQGIIWQFAGKDASKDPKNNKWVQEEDWVDMKLAKGSSGLYTLKFISATKEYEIDVCPSQKGKDYDSALASYEAEMTRYQAEQKARQIAAINANYQLKKFTRSLGVNNFGTYNHDIFYKRKKAVRMLADFDFGDLPEEDKTKATVFLITADKKAVIKYPHYAWKNFTFDPTDDNCLFAVLPNNKTATFSKENFEKIEGTLGKADNQGYKFVMDIQETPIKDIEDVTKLLL